MDDQEAPGTKRKRTDSRDNRAKEACQHTCCTANKTFSTRGGGLRDHQANRSLHKNCTSKCPLYISMHGERAIGEGSSHSSIPGLPLRVLMVLGTDFKRPSQNSKGKNYEMLIPFSPDPEDKIIPGFQQHSLSIKKSGDIKVNCWVMLFFLVIQQSSMMGEIVNYADFLKMEKKIYTFDIVIMACIGKEEIGTDGVLEHWEKMRQLEETIPIWPSVSEQMRHYRKLTTEKDLAFIAENVTRTKRPLTVFNPPERGGYVAKRSFSSDGRHVTPYLPSMVLEQPPQTKWFFQEFNPCLGSYGEIKVVIVNGKNFLVPILCKNTEGGNEQIERVISARELNSTPDSTSPFNDLGNAKLGGMDEMKSFCIRTLQALLDLEKQRQTEPLAIECLVRMDIGLVKQEGGNLNYYVNEISRPPCCSLMQSLEPDTNYLEIMARSVREGLVRTYIHHCQKYPGVARN